MRLNALDSLARVGPDLDLSVVAARVAEAFLVEGDARECSCRVGSAHDARLLESLSHVSRVPERHLLGSHRRESKIICQLRPGDVEDSVS